MSYSVSNTDQQILLVTSAVTTYAGGVMFVFGTMGNLMNIIVFCCLKSYRSLATSAFLATSSFAGQVYLTCSLGFGSLSKLIDYDIASGNSAICKSSLFIRKVSVQISLTCLCLSSIDRYLMTSRSADRRELITMKRARLLIDVCFLGWMCPEIPFALYTLPLTSFKICIPSSNFVNTAMYLNLVFAILLPISILSVFGLLTWRNLGNTRLTALNSQVTRMILLDIIVVALSNIPLECWRIYGGTTSVNQLASPTLGLVDTVTELVGAAQAAGSFYFYLLVSSAFRTNVKNMLRNVLCFWKPRIMRQIAPLAATVPMKILNVVL